MDTHAMDAHAMDAHDPSHTDSRIALPRKEARILNLKKCKFCRARKVKCKPPNRKSPDRCENCIRREEECSPPAFATRNQRTRRTSASTGSASLPAGPSITERSTSMQRHEPEETEGVDLAMARPDVRTGLSHRQIKDIVTILRCHYSECRVQLSQAQWIEKSFHDNPDFPSGNEFKRDVFQNVSDRMEALSKIRNITLDHLKSRLESDLCHQMEHILVYQLLVDVETSCSTFTTGAETVYSKNNPEFAAHQRALAEVLYQKGDDNGSLTLLHRIPLLQIGKIDWTRILEISQALRSRTKMIPMMMGMGDDPLIMEIFESMDTLAFPYSLLAIHKSQWINDDCFIRESFMWPWRRYRLKEELTDDSRESFSVFSTALPVYVRDIFGHSFLHALIYFQNGNLVRRFAKPLQSEGKMRSYLSTACPSYAEGFTPLACAASSLGNLDVFDHMVSISDQNLCTGSLTGTTGHAFCALTFAICNRNPAAVKTLLETATQREVDISDCCRWGKDNTSNKSLEIRTLLAEALQQPVSDSEEDEGDEEDEGHQEDEGDDENEEILENGGN